MNSLFRLVQICPPVFAMLSAGAALAAPSQRVQFNRDVRPILADRCWSCHGPDKNKRKAGLRLDQPEAALSRLKSGAVPILPSDPANSAVWQRITHADPDERMPPSDSPKQLTARDQDILRRWIAEGAVWQAHWAYVPPERAPLPAVKNQGWVAGAPGAQAIDHFVLARLQQEGLSPSPPAARHTLLRRLSFDLTGLPPTVEELDAFTRDTSPNAYAATVDRLLASPHFGERMAIPWLDLVRYADSVGYQSDNDREVSLYRDYVIRSFNENKPFDQFTVEQLAGDLLPGATFWQRVASGYNRLLQTTEEGGAQPREYAQKYLADRVRNASSVWLGATLGCAQCHDHKFDPYSLKDFYRFAAFFADIDEMPVGRREPDYLPDEARRPALEAADRNVRTLRKAMRASSPALAQAQRRWEKTLLGAKATDWTPLESVVGRSEAGARLLFMSNEDSFEVSGQAGAKDTYVVTMTIQMNGVTGFQLEALTQHSAPWLGPGRTPSGGFAITAVSATNAVSGTPIPLGPAVATRGTVRSGPGGPAWSVSAGVRTHERLLMRTVQPVDFGDDGRVTFVIEQNAGAGRTLGRFRLSATRDTGPLRTQLRRAVPADVVAAAARPRDQRSPDEQETITSAYRKLAPRLAGTRARLVAAERARADLVADMPRSLISTAVKPQVVRVLPRGNWQDESGEVVKPGVPQFLSSPANSDEAQRAPRLALARWLVSPSNPLTARVFVNRLWGHLFGAGLSRNQEDLGSQGDPPSHPELLDWLAVELRDSGWDIKRLVRMIVMSSAYQQASLPTRAGLERDPYNRLLARQSRFRLDAELVRDNALAVSGLLSRRIGGPSVKPYQPEGYLAYLNFPPREWVADGGEAQYRRGLYTFWQRTFLHPSLLAFDAPTREECTGERTRANIPQQALVLLNDPSFVEAARVFAAQVLRHGGATSAERLRWAYRRVLSRAPSAAEERTLTALHDKHLGEYRANPDAAGRLVSVGQAPPAPELDRAEVAAWTSVTRALLNAAETITRP